MNAIAGMLGLTFGLMILAGVACANPSPGAPTVAHGGSSNKKRAIILCTGNSCRSQMAEAFWKKYGGDRWEVVSAGTRPSGRVSPLAVQAMSEIGIDISGQKSKSVEPYVGQPFDLVITVCSDAEKSCPNFRGGRKYIHHGFDDPPKAAGTDEDRLRVCRRVRDEIEAKTRAWIAAESVD